MEQTSIRIEDVVIRKATADDAPEIANVHLNSWREAYLLIMFIKRQNSFLAKTLATIGS